MRSWRFHKFGDLKNLQLEDVPEPTAGPGEILLRVHFAALNPADQYLVRGLYPGAAKPPYAVGRDGAGVVTATGPECRRGFKEGDQVIVIIGDLGVQRPGTLADYVTVPESMLAPLPGGWSLEEGAAAPLTHLTAWHALVMRAALKSGENVLITGASGGVGTASVVLAKALGGRVAAFSRSAEKRKKLEALGADVALDPAAADLTKQLKAAFDGQGADVIIENLGGVHLARCLRMAASHARIQVVGLLSDFNATIQLGLVIHKRLKLEGIHVGDLDSDAAAQAWEAVVRRLDHAERRPLVDGVFPAESVHAAFARLAEGPMGKVLVGFGGKP